MPPVTNAIRRLVSISCLLTLHCQRHAHSAAHAQACEPFVSATSDHFVQQCDQNAATGSPDRVTEGDRPAVDVDSGGIPTHEAVHADRLSRERLVDFEQVQLLVSPASPAQTNL